MIRTRICFYVLLLAPLAVYWPTIFHDYGFRDDYSLLRESREEPGKIVKFTASHGRPLYGALLETTYGVTEDVAQLPWLRLASVCLLTVLGLALWRQLYSSGWTEVDAAAIGLGVTLLPAAQVLAGWAIGWPHALALLLSVAGFSAIETEVERGGLKRFVALLGGCMIYALASLIYQSNALFAVVPMAAVLLVRTGREPMSDFKWLCHHVGALLIGVVAGYLMVKALFANGVFHESARMQFETNPFTKLGWLFAYPLPNALGLFALRDDFHTGAAVFWGAVLVFLVVITMGFRLSAKGQGPLLSRKWVWCVIILPLIGHSVSLAAAERSTGYRVLFALSGLALVLVVYSLRVLATARNVKPLAHYITLGLLAIGAGVVASRQTFLLIAEPQGHEWDIIHKSVMAANFSKAVKVYVITPTLDDRSTTRVFQDEFGSLSGDSTWTPKEMFKAALHDRFQDKLPKGGSYTFTSGREVPATGAYDLVIDMRKLKQRKAQ